MLAKRLTGQDVFAKRRVFKFIECLLIGLGAYFIQHMGSFNYGKIRTMGAVLVAISIPIFTSQLEKSRDAVSVSNIRAAYAEASAKYLTSDNNGKGGTVTITGVQLKGAQSGWSDMESQLSFTHPGMTAEIGGQAGTYDALFTFGTDGSCTLTSLTKKS